MVSTVIIEYRFIYGSSAEIERYTFTYSPEARSLQQKYHSLPETTMPGVSSVRTSGNDTYRYSFSAGFCYNWELILLFF